VAWAAVLALVVYSTLGPSSRAPSLVGLPTAGQAPASRDERRLADGIEGRRDGVPAPEGGAKLEGAAKRAMPRPSRADPVAPAAPTPPAELDSGREQPEPAPAEQAAGGALADLESRARLAARSERKAAAAPPALLSPHPTIAGSALLQLTVPGAPAEVDVELRAIDGRRRLTERATTSAAGAVAVTLSADWLETGPYDVEVRDPSGRRLYTTRVQVRR
jgi:hypothetical protein